MLTNFTISRLLGRLFPWHDNRRVHQMADEIAQQCQAGLWQRVCHRTPNMSAAEIRGYAMAHATGFVENEVDRTLCCQKLTFALRSRVVETAVNQLIGMVIRDTFLAAPPDRTQMMAA